ALVRARTDGAADLALAGLEGKLREPIRAARSAALELLAYLGARADFPDEDVPLREIRPELAALSASLDQLVAGAAFGLIEREGVRVAIVGRPNAGKSSLLNALLRQERAIVTPVPGTTRDTLEEGARLGGLPFVQVDTAGFNEAPDEIERLGIARSAAALEAADVVLLVLDASLPLEAGDRALLARAGERPLLLAANKCDLPTALD